ncbi:hypothetical protein HanHA300_Chr17g0663871 [Helianthus annuus]|nr:hypothetical protein HanHA300_Chr17g0663871 [Helianthus annuus]
MIYGLYFPMVNRQSFVKFVLGKFVYQNRKYRMIMQPYCGEEKFHMVNVLNLLMMTYATAGI